MFIFIMFTLHIFVAIYEVFKTLNAKFQTVSSSYSVSISQKAWFSANLETVVASRMYTACLLPVSPSMHCTGGCLLLEVVVYFLGGVCSRRVCLLWGMSAPGWSALGSALRQTPPLREQNDRQV